MFTKCYNWNNNKFNCDKFDWQLGASNVDLKSRSVIFFSFLQSSCWDKDQEFKHKKVIYCENFIYIKSKCSWESEICWESGIIEVLKIISNGYFHGDHLEGIINPKFQLSIICSCRDIADFNMLKIQTKILQTRIWIYYIFLDFYAAELRLSEIEE